MKTPGDINMSAINTSSIQKKIQQKEQQASVTNPGDDWGGFFASLGRSLLMFSVFSILGVNIGYIMKRQNAEAKLPVDENVAPYGPAPDSTNTLTADEMKTITGSAVYKAATTATQMKQDVAEVGEALRGGSNGVPSTNPPLSIAYLGAKGGLIQQSWVYKEAKNPGSLSWILWEWFRNSAKFSWITGRSAVKSTMETLKEMMSETGVLSTMYVLMMFWYIPVLILMGILVASYIIGLGGVLMTTLTKWSSYWQLFINLILTFMLQGMTIVPSFYATGEILALIRYLVMPITHTVMVGGVEKNNFWHQIRSNYMVVWFFLFAMIITSAFSTLSNVTSGGITTGIVIIYLIMLINNRLAARK